MGEGFARLLRDRPGKQQGNRQLRKYSSSLVVSPWTSLALVTSRTAEGGGWKNLCEARALQCSEMIGSSRFWFTVSGFAPPLSQILGCIIHLFSLMNSLSAP